MVSNMIMVMVMVNMLMVINMAIKNIKVDWRYGELSRTKAAFYFVLFFYWTRRIFSGT